MVSSLSCVWLLWLHGPKPSRLFSVHVIFQARVLEWVVFPSPGNLPDLGLESGSPALQTDSLPAIVLDKSLFLLNCPAAAKSLQSCPILCDPIDDSPPAMGCVVMPYQSLIPCKEWIFQSLKLWHLDVNEVPQLDSVSRNSRRWSSEMQLDRKDRKLECGAVYSICIMTFW